MKEEMFAQRKRLWLAVLVVILTSYAATWILGVRSVRGAHMTDLSLFYKKQKVFYSSHKAELEENVFWKTMLDHHNGFPSWEEYQLWMAAERDDRYYAIFPMVILSWREQKGRVPGNGVGTIEYHLWCIFGSRLIKRQLLWIE